MTAEKLLDLERIARDGDCISADAALSMLSLISAMYAELATARRLIEFAQGTTLAALNSEDLNDDEEDTMGGHEWMKDAEAWLAKRFA